MREIKLTQGKTAFIDDDDFEKLSKFKWCYSKSTGYAVRKGRKASGEPRTVHMHRYIVLHENRYVDEVDHINGNKLDNRKCNLRTATCQKNAFNRKKPNVNSTSKYKGVLKRKNSTKWEARLKINNKAIYLGKFADEVDAALAYNSAALKYYGPYARLNRIQDVIAL